MLRRFTVLCVVTVIAGLFQTAEAGLTTQPAPSTIAVFRLSGDLGEHPPQQGLFSAPEPWLLDVILRMKKAESDPNVKAVVIEADEAAFGQAQAEELRQAISALQTAGKPVYAYSDSMMMHQYLLCCGASRISVAPTGMIIITGLYAESPYVRGLLDKIGVQPDFIHCGAYKDAADIFMRDGPTPETDEMTNWLLDSIFDSDISAIATGRNVSKDQAHSWIDTGLYTAEAAKTAGLIDAVEDQASFESMLKDKYGADVIFDKQYGAATQPKLDFSNPFAMFAVIAQMMHGGNAAPTKPTIGVVYVDGMILTGRSQPGLFGGDSNAMSTDISRALDQAANDDNVKAVILRIDSPGGSGIASEIILRATQRVKAKKPFIVSMGDIAGSGGYYVACGTDTIFADNATITGSIGVLGGKFATTEMWNKLGVTWKSYGRGASADLFSTDSVFSPDQRQKLQTFMDGFYATFKSHVTDSRGAHLTKPIDDIAGGRVYTGKQGLDLGLVDKIGTLEDAITFAAAQAKITDYDVRPIPEAKNALQQLMEQASGGADEPGVLTSGSPDYLLKAAAPWLATVDPQHASLIESALKELQVMQNEGVVLMMAPTGIFYGPASR